MQERDLARGICVNTSGTYCRCALEQRPWPGSWCHFVVDRVRRLKFIESLVEKERCKD